LAVALACCRLGVAAEEKPATPAAAATQTAPAQAVKLATDTDKASYSIGADIGRSFKEGGPALNLDALVAGLKDSYAGRKLQLTEEESRAAIEAIQKEFAATRAKQLSEQGAKNKAEGEKFLAENGKKEGVKTLPAGLQYKVVKMGDGKKPKATDMVKTTTAARSPTGRSSTVPTRVMNLRFSRSTRSSPAGPKRSS